MQITAPDSEELKEKEYLLKKVSQLAEMNPMLGYRGCRLGMLNPEIYEMQARAIFNAVVTLMKKGLR